ncbi:MULTISPECIES: YkvI family membrane protein [Cytobacillus]|uniref:Transporter n=1 Tax=Cytobacillus kochii TaxID=859143 RepID=A0A248TMX2_9BACI|nr:MULTISPECIES: hypothetical protein [Cytobacillus]ASV69556.1 hypothetical protein CKF48_20920 [Cytobacillus kochii]MDQ0184336.1 putative membrane protein YkvI [Cytobacillus kochii]MEA1852488.1 hypothetical protein [Cytobacillus sp. OWB-43]
MRKIIQIAGAYIGTIIGAGFASGQEVLQFFTNFGWLGFIGTIAATILFIFLGMNITQIGSRLQTESHKDVVHYICGKYIGRVVDFIITFFLFGVATIMFAGAGSTFEQQFGIASQIGSLIMVLLTVFTCFVNVNRVMTIIGSITPFLLMLVMIISAYALFTADANFSQLSLVAQEGSPAAPHWLLGAVLYVSYNITCGVAMLAVMGGTTKNAKQAGWGGVLGGLGLGLMLILINVGMFTRIEDVATLDIPMLYLANEISPIIGVLMTIILLGMIYNTAVGMIYSFTSRIVKRESKHFKWAVLAISLTSFVSSFFGFTNLVGILYPITGYLGLVLIAAVIIAWVRNRKTPYTQVEKKSAL